MFIASQWDSQKDAMAFFRSDDFQTVDWRCGYPTDRGHVFRSDERPPASPSPDACDEPSRR